MNLPVLLTTAIRPMVSSSRKNATASTAILQDLHGQHHLGLLRGQHQLGLLRGQQPVRLSTAAATSTTLYRKLWCDQGLDLQTIFTFR